MTTRPPLLLIERRKLTGYLLKADHAVGGPKAKFFMAHGFRVDAPERLADALIRHAQEGWPGQLNPRDHGPLHLIRGKLETPRRTEPLVCSIWQPSGAYARFVTAYPE